MSLLSKIHTPDLVLNLRQAIAPDRHTMMTNDAVTALAHALTIAMTVGTVGHTERAPRTPITATVTMNAATAILESVTIPLAGVGVRRHTLTASLLVPGLTPRQGIVTVVNVMQRSVAVAPPHQVVDQAAKATFELYEVRPPMGNRRSVLCGQGEVAVVVAVAALHPSVVLLLATLRVQCTDPSLLPLQGVRRLASLVVQPLMPRLHDLWL